MSSVSETAIARAALDPSQRPSVDQTWPAAARAAALSHPHVVEFYEDDAFLASKVSEFLAVALSDGGVAIGFATRAHLDAIEIALCATGIDLEPIKREGRFVLLDARQTLAHFCSNGVLDRIAFHEHLGNILTRARESAGAGPMRIYGEMVDLLFKDGSIESLIRLEDSWAELAKQHGFSLLCGYQLTGFADQRFIQIFKQICDRHSEVHTQRTADVPLNESSHRIIAELEQRTSALETEIERRHRLSERMEQLLDLAGELARAAGSEKMTSIIVENGREAVGARAAGVWLLDAERKQLSILKATGYAAEVAEKIARLPLSGPEPLCAAVREGHPIFIDSESGSDAVAYLPLIVEGLPLGGLVYTFSEPRRFDEADQTFMRILKRQCAQALDRARLYEAERAARLEAERAQAELARAYREEREAHLAAKEATRAREEILAVVSHDLRNPLGAILMTAASLLQTDLSDKKLHRIRSLAERVHRNAERMASLIEDLVDFANIQAGRLRVDPKHEHIDEIVNSAVEMLLPLAEDRHIDLGAHMPPDLPPVVCDRDRLIQSLSNLVSNAINVTASGGRIRVEVEAQDKEVICRVCDTGPGVDPQELPQIFDLYFRSKRAGYKGAGIGLSIAKGIVEALGGKIWAESEFGVGSTFSFSVPRAQL